jgi:hypothetical protein
MTAVAGRVATGLALIYERDPELAELLDPATLDISDPRSCALGQLYGTFDDGLDALGLTICAAAGLGFTCEAGDDAPDEVAGAQFAELTAEWRRVLEARRPAA